MRAEKIAVIGAGPSGMACALTLSAAGHPCAVIEKDSAPGGFCQTVNFHGYLFDIGGHRLISKSEEINRLWRCFMGDDLLKVKRLSRIYYRSRYFNYPLSFFNACYNLGLLEGFWCFTSYLKAKYFNSKEDKSLEEWIVNRFGERLFYIFFKTYSEKVWGMECQHISADWAKQRIQGLSLKVAIQKAIFNKRNNAPKTLSEEFYYPSKGPGEFYRRIKDFILEKGSEFRSNIDAVRLVHDNGKITSIVTADKSNQDKIKMDVDYLFTSMPLPRLIRSLDPQPPGYVLESALRLRFRSIVIINVILDRAKVFSDQWVYVHSPEVKLARVQNYKNWSPDMVADANKTSLGLEYFCDEEDHLWAMNDVDLIEYAIEELERIGIASRKYLINAFVVRRANAYPVYHLDYQKDVGILRDYLSKFSNMQTMGRSGLFRYDNSDHALLTGIYAARNFLGQGCYDLWSVNADESYIES